jgi:hypothetical protein
MIFSHPFKGQTLYVSAKYIHKRVLKGNTSILTLSKLTLNIMTLSILTLSIMAQSKRTLGTKTHNMTLSLT